MNTFAALREANIARDREWNTGSEKLSLTGMLHGRLVGRKNHMRMWCEGSCKRQMME